MAKRLTDTEIWDKQWFMELSPRLKCLVKVIRDKCDLAGVWSPNWNLINAYVGEPVSEEELLKIDNGRQFKKAENGKIICVDFIEFQYGKLSPKSPVHRKVMQILDSHKIGYQYPINRGQEKEEDKEEEKDKEKDKEKEEVKATKKTKADDHYLIFKDASEQQLAFKRIIDGRWSNVTKQQRQKLLEGYLGWFDNRFPDGENYRTFTMAFQWYINNLKQLPENTTNYQKL